jgi:hypothetical protein
MINPLIILAGHALSNPTNSSDLEISLMLSRRGKFHLDPLISHFMLRHTPKDYFYNYPVIEQRLTVPKCTTTYSEKQ